MTVKILNLAFIIMMLFGRLIEVTNHPCCGLNHSFNTHNSIIYICFLSSYNIMGCKNNQ